MCVNLITKNIYLIKPVKNYFYYYLAFYIGFAYYFKNRQTNKQKSHYRIFYYLFIIIILFYYETIVNSALFNKKRIAMQHFLKRFACTYISYIYTKTHIYIEYIMELYNPPSFEVG